MLNVARLGACTKLLLRSNSQEFRPRGHEGRWHCGKWKAITRNLRALFPPSQTKGFSKNSKLPFRQVQTPIASFDW